jgi:hypothetical protein
MHAIGFFRQLEHGLAHGPDLAQALEVPLPAEQRAPLARYLRSGEAVAVTGSRAADVFKPELGEILAINVLTDGEYVWSEDLAYYVETYGARPPQEFIDHVKRHDGVVPALDTEALAALVSAAREAMAEQR